MFVYHPLTATVLARAAEIGSLFERIEQLMKIHLVALEATTLFHQYHLLLFSPISRRVPVTFSPHNDH